MRELVEVIFLLERHQKKFYRVDSIGQPCSRIVTPTEKRSIVSTIGENQHKVSNVIESYLCC